MCQESLPGVSSTERKGKILTPGLLRPCDILLYRGKGFVSGLIQWGTKSPYNHVAVVVDPPILLGIESNTGTAAGVRAMDLRKLFPWEIDVFRIRPGFSVSRDDVISFLVSRLGARFDFAGVTWLGILKALSLLTGFRYRPYNGFQKEKDYFCSELCYEAFKAGGLDIVPEVGESEVTSPGDIASSAVVEKILAGN
jgi:hypothetical protein